MGVNQGENLRIGKPAGRVHPRPQFSSSPGSRAHPRRRRRRAPRRSVPGGPRVVPEWAPLGHSGAEHGSPHGPAPAAHLGPLRGTLRGRGARRIPGTSLNQQLRTAGRRGGENPTVSQAANSPNGGPETGGDSHASIDDIVAHRRSRLDPGRARLTISSSGVYPCANTIIGFDTRRHVRHIRLQGETRNATRPSSKRVCRRATRAVGRPVIC